MSKKVVSLFSGAGGLDLGFQKEGFDIIWANDKFEDICRTYSNNIGDHITCKDLNEVDIQSIPEADIIIGGPPCQSFSLIGKRDPEDERGDLAWKYIEILEEKKPEVFLFENVTGIKSAKTEDGKKALEVLKSLMEDLGYTIQVYTLNAANYGVPQRRKRVFIVGSLNGNKISKPQETHSKKPKKLVDGTKIKKWVSVKDALDDLPPVSEEDKDGLSYEEEPKTNYQSMMRENSEEVHNHYMPTHSDKDMEIIKEVTPGGNYYDVPDDVATDRIKRLKEEGGRTTCYGRLDPKEPSYTINTYFNRPNVGCNIHYSKDRLISLREGLRLQSFPDDFILYSTTQRDYYNMVGNAVPPLLSQAWAKELKNHI